MIDLKAIFRTAALLAALSIGGAAVAQEAPSAAIERFAGEAQVGSQPRIPIHLELRRSGDSVRGTILIPGGAFELVETHGGDPIIGRFHGAGGAGDLTLRVDANDLTGAFDLGGQPGTIAAQRTHRSAEAFFQPPERRLELTAAEWREDLDRFVEILTREHASPFHRVSRNQFQSEVSRIRSAIPHLDGAAVALEFRKLGALIGDGHTSAATPHGRPRLPIELYWFEDGLRIVSVSTTHRDLLGAKLVAVNEISADDVVERARALIPQGETQGFHRERAPDLLSDPDALRAIGFDTKQPFVFDFEAADGARKRVDVAAAIDARDWVTLGQGAPLWRRNEGSGFWSERLADGGVYVNWRSYDGLANHSAALLRSLDDKHPRKLIVDLRDNDGGDYAIGRAFVEGIRNRPWLNRRGALYVMIGRKTFSAAMTNAVDFKRTTEAVLVGEPAGAAPNNWQEARRLHLPNSGLRVSVSTRYYEFLPGEAEVSPDLHAPPKPSDWGDPQDAGVKLILAQPDR